nr:hypothetical protein [Tanacetum cinerariifolium]
MVLKDTEFFNELGKLHKMLNWEQHGSCISLSRNHRRPTKAAIKVHVCEFVNARKTGRFFRKPVKGVTEKQEELQMGFLYTLERRERE